MKVRNLDGIIVDILSHHEIETDIGIFRLKAWFYDKNEDVLEKLKRCYIEYETDEAILVSNGNEQLWIPRSVIENVR